MDRFTALKISPVSAEHSVSAGWQPLSLQETLCKDKIAVLCEYHVQCLIAFTD